ncbi:MAG: sugar nucleotide-binding protein [Clostridia bacterium]|nr:sugar nucleotide-binding protein [Clostridia bacterium]MBR1685264.1 sugar nucleotide-binding protein [Clostridia bacterium]
MKVLVTGPHGFVGVRIMAALKDAIPAPSLRDADEDEIKRLVERIAPDVIIHTAAMSDIATCERDPEGSYRANIALPVWLAATGVKLIAFSTDQVYSGCTEDGPYTEDMGVSANLYGRHKLEMEKRTLDINPDTVLLRATWMYDMPVYGEKNRGNFLINMLRSREQAFSAVQHRAVTYARDVADCIQAAICLPGGVYNFGSENDLTMLETAMWLKQKLDLPVTLRDAGERHALWMDCRKIQGQGIIFPDTVCGLQRCMNDYGLADI